MSPRPPVTRFRGDGLDRRRLVLGVGAFAPLSAGPFEPGDALFLEVDGDDPTAVAATLPAPIPGVPLVLGPERRAPPRSALSRWFGGRPPRVPRGVRGAALLLAGYVEVGGDPAADVVWGSAP